LKLDLQKIARARAKILARPSAMDYLISPIRRELEERVMHGGASQSDNLVIDFANGDLALDNSGSAVQGRITRCSLLEAGSPGIEVLNSFANQSMGCVVINLQPSWLDFQGLISAVSRLLRPGGSLYFSTFGPDTLREIGDSWVEVDELPHVHPFVDMHHLGDELLRAGFVQPIVDADWIFVEYPDIDVVIADLKQEGFTSILPQRRKTLTGVKRFSEFRKNLNQVAGNGDNLTITFEIIYGYARISDLTDGAIRVTPPSLDSL
jgi:SAM-dependent methyltransferase